MVPALTAYRAGIVERRARLQGGLSLMAAAMSHWRVILATFLVCTAVCAALLLRMPKRYTAEAVLIFDPGRSENLEGSNGAAALQVDATAINSEVSLIQLPTVAERVIETLHLLDDPDYRSAPGFLAKMSGLFGKTQGPAAGASAAPDAPSGPTPSGATPSGATRPVPNVANTPDLGLSKEDIESAAIDAFERHLAVSNDPKTYTIRVRYTGTDRRRVAEIANAVVEQHLALERRSRADALNDSTAWLNLEKQSLQDRLARSEQAEQSYRHDNQLGDDKVASIAQQEVNGLAWQASVAGAELAQAQAKLTGATTGIMTSLQEQVRVAIERETEIKAQLEEARKKLAAVMNAQTGLAPLVREVAASRAQLEDLVRRARNAEVQLDAPRAQARIVSLALPPQQPSGPSRLLFFIAAVLGSAFMACGVGALQVLLKPGFRSAEQAERVLGFSSAGELPCLPSEVRHSSRLIQDDPTHGFVEALRGIWVSLLQEKGKCQVVMITSPAAGDGKTMLTTSLAQALAATGRTCLLVDADLRRPTAHRHLGLPQKKGLAEVLAGAAAFDTVVQKGPNGLSFLSAGEMIEDPLRLLSPMRLAPFLHQACKSYDVILLDTPPVLRVSDASLMARHADVILLALRWSSTPVSAAERAITLLQRSASPRLRLVMTQIDYRKMGRYEPGYYGMSEAYDSRAWIRPGLSEEDADQRQHPSLETQAALRSTPLAGLASAVLLASGLYASDAKAEYRLDSGDVVEVSVFGVDEFKRKVSINIDGDVSLPLLGDIHAAGTTLSELRAKLKDALIKNNVIRSPDVTVVLAELRPFFIDGDVAKPGAHPYQKDLTVRRAVAVAGGYDLIRLKIDNPILMAADLRSQYEGLWTDFIRRQARVISLRAALEDKDQVDLSALEEAPVAKRILGEIMALEQDHFQMELSNLKMEKEHLKRSLAYSQDAAALLTKGQKEDEASAQAQLESLDRVRDLSNRGMTPSNRLVEEQRQYSIQKSREFDTESRLTQANATIEASDRAVDRVDVERKIAQSRELQDAVVELEKVRTQLQGVGEKLLYMGAIKAQMASGGQVTPNVSIYRTVDGKPTWIKADENTLVLPGDIIDLVFSQKQLLLSGEQ